MLKLETMLKALTRLDSMERSREVGIAKNVKRKKLQQRIPRESDYPKKASCWQANQTYWTTTTSAATRFLRIPLDWLLKGSTHCTTLSSVEEEEEEEEDEGRQDTHTSGQFAMQIEASLPPVLRRKEKKLQHQTQTEEKKPKKR